MVITQDGTALRPSSFHPTTSFGHVPALDGLRAVAVAAVLLFHGGFTRTPGGFLGVSVFFTLSGFLIASILLRGWANDATIDLRGFWSRRFRRLLAASWLTIGLVLVMGLAGIWDDSQMRSLRGDVPWSLAELANWHFIAQGTNYGASQSPPSPLEHFWSLAIEQQFYVLLPVLLIVVLGRGAGTPRRRLRTAVVVLGVLTVTSAVANGVLARTSIDRAYFGTDTRAAELLIGVLLAVALLGRIRFDARPRRVAVTAGTIGAVVLVALVAVAHLSSPWLYPWGLLLTAACTGAVVVAALQEGAMARVLALTPVVALGRISYGVYLLHWPVFLWLTPRRTGVSGPVLFGLRVAVTLVAAALMYRWVEHPIRSRRAISWQQARVTVPCAAVGIVLATAWITADVPGPPEYLVARAPGDVRIREVPASTTSTPPAATGSEVTTIPAAPPATTPPATTPPSTTPPATSGTAPLGPRHPRRVLLVGDSVAASLEDALGDALNARGITFAAAAAGGCGVTAGDPADEYGNPSTITAACNGAIPRIQREAISRARPDLVVALSTWETTDRIVDGRWYQVGSLEWAQVMHRLYGETIQRLSVRGARVAFLTIADVVDGEILPGNADTNRRGRLVNDVLTTIGATAPGVDTLGFDRIVCPTTPCPVQVDGITLRPRDGRHFDQPPGQRYVAERLAAQIAALDLNGM